MTEIVEQKIIISPLIRHKWRTNLDEIATRIIQPYKFLTTCKFC